MRKLTRVWNELGLTPWKEIALFVIPLFLASGLGVALFLWKGLGFLLAIPVFFLLGFLLWYFSRYGTMKRNALERRNREFVDLFTFFGIFIGNGFTVYNALEEVKGYASEDFAPLLESLLKGIDEDKTVAPFVAFASHFQNIAVKEVMLSLFQMVDEGRGGPYLRQYQRLFGRLSESRHELDKNHRLERLDTMAFLPLCGAGIAMLALTLSIMEVMGGLMNVL